MTVDVCIECEQDLEHCHGTAIVHFDGSADCGTQAPLPVPLLSQSEAAT